MPVHWCKVLSTGDYYFKVLSTGDYYFKVAHYPVFSRSTNLESKLIDFFVLLKH